MPGATRQDDVLFVSIAETPPGVKLSSLLVSVGLESVVLAAFILIPLSSSAPPDITPPERLLVLPQPRVPEPPRSEHRPTRPSHPVEPRGSVVMGHLPVALDSRAPVETRWPLSVESEDGLFDLPAGSPGGVPGVPDGLGGASASPPSDRPKPSAPLPVGGLVEAPRKVHHVSPVYPEIARIARVEGLIVLETTIGTDGRVQNIRVLRSSPLLEDAAVAAVSQWRFEPTLLNGVPVPILMTVTVHFRL